MTHTEPRHRRSLFAGLRASFLTGLVVIAPGWSRRLVNRGWPKLIADAVCVPLPRNS